VRRWVAAWALIAAACAGDEVIQESQLGDFSRLGFDVDIDGLYAAAAAYQEDGQQGAVYVYTRAGDVWSPQARVLSPSPSSEQFGFSVALSGTTLVVGAPFDNQPGANRAGSVYVFVRSGSDWNLQATLASPASQPFEFFGGDVAVAGDTLVVGAVDRDVGGNSNAGAAFVFQRSGTSWSFAQQLDAAVPAAQDKFGNALALGNDRLAIGALRRGGNDAGSVFIYGRTGSTFTFQQEISASDPAVDALFGTSVALAADAGTERLFVGAEGAAAGGTADSGAVYVFESTGATFSFQQKLTASDAATGDRFGGDVDSQGARLLVGASGAEVDGVNEAGAAYVFEEDGSSWSETAKLVRSRADDRAFTATAVALQNDFVLLGATGEQIGAARTDTGAVVAFSRNGSEWSEDHTLTAASRRSFGSYGRFGLCITSTVMTASSLTRVDVYGRDRATWSLQASLPPVDGTSIQDSATDGERVAFVGRASFPDPDVPIGFVQVWAKAGDDWQLEDSLEPDLVAATQPDEAGNGLVVDLLGDTMAVGAPRFNGGDGRVFIIERAGTGDWSVQDTFTSPQAASNFDMNYGRRVDLSGDTLAVAEVPSSGIPNTPQNGQVFIYDRQSGSFVQTQVLTAPIPAPTDFYGSDISLDGDLLAVVAPSVVRIYRRVGGVFSEVDSLAVAASSVEVEGDRLVLGVPSSSYDGFTDAGEVQLYERQPNDTWSLTGVRRPMNPTAGQQVGTRVELDGSIIVGATGEAGGQLFVLRP
jgi:hypothetical protein